MSQEKRGTYFRTPAHRAAASLSRSDRARALYILLRELIGVGAPPDVIARCARAAEKAAPPALQGLYRRYAEAAEAGRRIKVAAYSAEVFAGADLDALTAARALLADEARLREEMKELL